MTFDPITAHLAVEATRAHVGSARPDAPVIPDRRTRTQRTAAARTTLAARLHGLAHWVEPTPRRTCQPS